MTNLPTTAMPLPAWPHSSPRVRALVESMSLEEKLAQLTGFWVDQGDDIVAPMADELATSHRYDDLTAHGLGHLTRVYGTRPVDPVSRATWLWEEQRRLRERSGHGIPAIVHEECLTGLAAWKAATFPTPLAWGATFDPELVGEMAGLIGSSMRELGIHQGLAPVLDVICDARWGRVDECLGEDPYLVGTLGTSYVRGLQGAGVHATLKHFVGYSASRAGRNHAPVSLGPRELADVYLPPFEMALHDGGARSVMNSYCALDGIPVAADEELLTGLLRERWGFDGTVVSDYFAVAFLDRTHHVASDPTEAAAQALRAGIDVELPTADAFLGLVDAVRSGGVPEALLDRAVLRVLNEKEELGLLDTHDDEPPSQVSLDSAAHRDCARRVAEESLVLLRNDCVLPIQPGVRRIAVVGPNADRSEALMGCYSFTNHVLAHHPEVPVGIDLPTVLEAVRGEFPGSEVVHAPGCGVEGPSTDDIAEAARIVRDADVAVVVLGDQAGLFGRGTVGEGNDVDSLDLPGAQRQLVEALRETGTPVVAVLITGRPYAIDWMLDDGAPGAVLQAFFPGEEGGAAVARILSGAVNPSGRLPVSLPRSVGSQPYTYRHTFLGGPNEVTSADPTPARPFGFGLSYTRFEHTGLTCPKTTPTHGAFPVSVEVRNVGAVTGDDVVQLYAHDVVASVAQPVAQLVAYHRLALEPGETRKVTFEVPTARLAVVDRSLERVVEPGAVELWVGSSCTDKETTTLLTLTGDVHVVTAEDGRIVRSSVACA